MKRKILSLVLASAMTLGVLTSGAAAAGQTYSDTKGHWAESSIERWSDYKIVQGSDGQFNPDDELNCAQLATILANLLKLPAAKDAGFTDNAADAWYYDAINRCVAAGIIKGNGDGTVSPMAPIARERAMVMLGRALGVEPIANPDLSKYQDSAKVAPYAQGMIAAMIEAGIISGVGGNQLAPTDEINRASAVTILDRAISVYANVDGATVDAKDAKLVLVVAKDVKIVNAPVGARIIVVDTVTGTTVNGKAISAGETYVVPAAPVSGGGSYTPPPQPTKPVIVIGGKTYFYDSDKKEYFTGEGDKKEYVNIDKVKEDAKENSTIIVDGKEYTYDEKEGEWSEVGNPGNQKPDDQIFEKVD